MPLYEYECDGQHHRFEVIQKFSDPPVSVCPTCGSAVHKLISSPAFQFKGTGWYITDYAKKEGGAGAGKGESKDKDASASGSDKAEKAEKSDKSGNAEKSETSDKPEKSDKSAKSETTASAPKTDSAPAPKSDSSNKT